MKSQSLVFVLAAGTFLVFFAGAALAEESGGPAYKVAKEYDDFELRKYDSYLVAEVEVKSDLEGASYKAFRTLFEFIDGNNVRSEEIAMTSPVVQEPSEEGEKIAMTSPVVQEPSGKEKTYKVGFVMPGKYTLETLPKPADPKVKIRKVPERLVAVRRYSGTWSESNYRENEKALLEAIKEAGLETAGDPVWARYDPPWSLWFNRRNEVMVEVKDTDLGALR